MCYAEKQPIAHNNLLNGFAWIRRESVARNPHMLKWNSYFFVTHLLIQVETLKKLRGKVEFTDKETMLSELRSKRAEKRN